MLTVVCQDIQFNNIQGIIFDKDGTLADSQHFLYKLAQQRASLIAGQIPGIEEQLLAAFGIEGGRINPLGLMAVGSRLENEIAAAGYIAARGKSWFTAMAIARQSFLEADEYVSERADTSPIFSGAKEVLRLLSHAGLKLGILSADSTSGVEAFIKKHQLCDYIQLAMGVDSQLTKPNPELFRRACKALAIPPEATLMVGDSPGDIAMAKGAQAAGAIAITQHYQALEHLGQADIIINNLKKLAILA